MKSIWHVASSPAHPLGLRVVCAKSGWSFKSHFETGIFRNKNTLVLQSHVSGVLLCCWEEKLASSKRAAGFVQDAVGSKGVCLISNKGARVIEKTHEVKAPPDCCSTGPEFQSNKNAACWSVEYIEEQVSYGRSGSLTWIKISANHIRPLVTQRLETQCNQVNCFQARRTAPIREIPQTKWLEKQPHLPNEKPKQELSSGALQCKTLLQERRGVDMQFDSSRPDLSGSSDCWCVFTRILGLFFQTNEFTCVERRPPGTLACLTAAALRLTRTDEGQEACVLYGRANVPRQWEKCSILQSQRKFQHEIQQSRSVASIKEQKLMGTNELEHAQGCASLVSPSCNTALSIERSTTV